MDTHDIWSHRRGHDLRRPQLRYYAGGTGVHVDNHVLAFVPGSSSVMLTGSDGGVYVCKNGECAARDPRWRSSTPTFTQIS